MIHFLTSPWLYLGGFVITVAIVLLCQDRIKLWTASARRTIANTFLPFSVIASELRRMNDLKELELTERLNPVTGKIDGVTIIKENPSKHDTEVFFGEEPEPKGVAAMRKNLTDIWERDAADEEEE